MNKYIVTAMLFLIITGLTVCINNNRNSLSIFNDVNNGRSPQIPDSNSISYSVVYRVDGRYAAWPANNGIWHYADDDKIVVGFTSAEFNKDGGFHKISDSRRESYLASSIDGGKSWNAYDPENYVGDDADKKELNEKIDFKHSGFTMRVAAATYHGTDDPQGRFYYSYDKGRNWKGPFPLGKIHLHDALKGKIITARTDYIVLGKYECMLMVSAKPGDDFKGESGPMTDKTFCIKTVDGGKTFEFVSWIVPLSDPYRAVMPNTIKISDNHFVSVLRRKILGAEECWIDAYGTEDAGKTWKFLSRVGETGVMNNGNPPAIALLKDGSLCAVYGNRDKKKILARYSTDNGNSWGEEFVVRQNKPDYTEVDLGYPRLTCLNDGSLLAVYYWVSKEYPVQCIESAKWKP